MSLLQVPVAAPFPGAGPVPGEADLVAGLEQDRFRPFEDGSEERTGWCDWRTPAHAAGSGPGDRARPFALRIDTRRSQRAVEGPRGTPAQQIVKEKDLAGLGREARISLQDEVKAELLQKVPPTPKVVEVAWDLKGGASDHGGFQQGAERPAGLFMKSFGCELQPWRLWCWRPAPHLPVDALMALIPRLELRRPNEHETDGLLEQGRFLGEEFIPWP